MSQALEIDEMRRRGASTERTVLTYGERGTERAPSPQGYEADDRAAPGDGFVTDRDF